MYYVDVVLFVSVVDIVNLQILLYLFIEWLFDVVMIVWMKCGVYLINIVCVKLVDCDVVVNVVMFGYFVGYGGDVWFLQLVLVDYLWCMMLFNGMMLYILGMLLLVQVCYVVGMLEIL